MTGEQPTEPDVALRLREFARMRWNRGFDGQLDQDIAEAIAEITLMREALYRTACMVASDEYHDLGIRVDHANGTARLIGLDQ